jgi:GNAT superfamily N-acetyltransferase
VQEPQLFTIKEPAQGAGDACDSILRDLPEWFGIESAIEHYVQACQSLPTLIAQMAEQPVGLLALKQHSSYAAEVYVMAVRPHFHRKGIGKALLIEAEKYLAKCGVEYLQVKTLAPSHPSSHYASTREFYTAMGFKPLEEFPTLWGAENPCLIMVKCLACRTHSSEMKAE